MQTVSTCPQHEADAVIRKDQTVGELVIRHPRLRARLEQLGIDYCCRRQEDVDEGRPRGRIGVASHPGGVAVGASKGVGRRGH